VTLHCSSVANDVVPVVTICTTGTEGCDIVLGDVNSESAGCGKMLLTQPEVIVASNLLDGHLGVLCEPAGLNQEYFW